MNGLGRALWLCVGGYYTVMTGFAQTVSHAVDGGAAETGTASSGTRIVVAASPIKVW